MTAPGGTSPETVALAPIRASSPVTGPRRRHPRADAHPVTDDRLASTGVPDGDLLVDPAGAPDRARGEGRREAVLDEQPGPEHRTAEVERRQRRPQPAQHEPTGPGSGVSR